MAILTATASLAAMASGIGLADGAVAPPRTETVWLESNLRELYPSEAGVCLSSYQQMDDAPGVVLMLRSDVADFSHYRYELRRDTLPAEAPRENRSGAIAVRFDPTDPRPQSVVTVIQAVTKSGGRSRPYSVEIAYAPREYFAASGHRTRSWLVVRASDLLLCGSSVEDWIVERPSARERAYARKRWGRLIRPLPSDYEKARAIARDLIRALRAHEGIPSDEMQFASGFEQLARAESGRDRVWCGNYADIFSAACNAVGIPARKIDMQYPWSARFKTYFEIAEGHRTNEVFDRSLNRWVWMDLTFGHWGARLDDGEPLDMADLVRALNDRRLLQRLRIVEYDAERDVAREVPVTESRHGKDLLRFFRQDQRYKYIRRAAAAGP